MRCIPRLPWTQLCPPLTAKRADCNALVLGKYRYAAVRPKKSGNHEIGNNSSTAKHGKKKTQKKRLHASGSISVLTSRFRLVLAMVTSSFLQRRRHGRNERVCHTAVISGTLQIHRPAGLLTVIRAHTRSTHDVRHTSKRTNYSCDNQEWHTKPRRKTNSASRTAHLLRGGERCWSVYSLPTRVA